MPPPRCVFLSASGVRSERLRHPQSRFQMQEQEARETGEVGVEGDEAAPANDGQGGQIGIGPHPIGQRVSGGERMD